MNKHHKSTMTIMDFQKRYNTEEACPDALFKMRWFLRQRLRKAMQNRDEKYMLEGVVELDDSYFGSPTKGGKRGRGTDKKVIVALQTKEGKPKYLKMKKLENLRGTTIGKYANANIKEGSRIESNAASSYKKPLAEKYMHHYEVFNPDAQHLVWLHTMISNAKSFIQGTYHGIAPKQADLYLTEFCFRFNRRFFHETLFERLALAAVNAPVWCFKSLVTNS